MKRVMHCFSEAMQPSDAEIAAALQAAYSRSVTRGVSSLLNAGDLSALEVAAPAAPGRQRHVPPNDMKREEAVEWLRQETLWNTAGKRFKPKKLTRCCARVNESCSARGGKVPGSTRTAVWRAGVDSEHKICNYCYPLFNHVRKNARKAKELFPDMV